MFRFVHIPLYFEALIEIAHYSCLHIDNHFVLLPERRMNTYKIAFSHLYMNRKKKKRLLNFVHLNFVQSYYAIMHVTTLHKHYKNALCAAEKYFEYLIWVILLYIENEIRS